MTKQNKSGDVLDVAGMQQLVDHVKNEQRLHPVVGKAFPSFGERDVAEPARMSKEAAIVGVRHGRRVLGPVRFGKLFGLIQRRFVGRLCQSRKHSGFTETPYKNCRITLEVGWKLMFVGHYSVAFAAKRDRNQIPLWVLFIAVQFLDYIWATLVLLGIEKLRVIKGFTAGSMLDSYFHPYSHSLLAAVLWSGVAALCYKLICDWRGYGYTKSAALVVGAALFSHWILDLIAHPRDLPIYDNTAKVGFGLWNYRDPEFALEIGLLGVGIMLYLTRNAMLAIRKGAVITFGVALVVIQMGDTYVPRNPLTDKATAMGVWVFYTLFVVVAFLIEKILSRRQTNTP